MLTKILKHTHKLIQKLSLKHKVIAVIAVLAIIAVIAQTISSKFDQSPIEANEQPYPEIIVNQSTRFDIEEKIEEKTTEFQDEEWTIVTVPSTRSPYKPDRFYLSGDVVLMKEQWYEPVIYKYPEKQLLEKFGNPERTMYVNKVIDMPIKALLYPQRGMAAYVYTTDSMVSHIQFFSPMSMDNYLNRWGDDLVQSMPTPPQPASHGH